MATEWLDPMDYIEELENEKENLLIEVEELTRKNKSLIEYIDKQDLKNSQDVVDERDEWKRRAIEYEDLLQAIILIVR